jgi:hypothetical protein
MEEIMNTNQMHFEIINGFKVFYNRRRYGSITYTWVFVDINGYLKQLGDPWPCIRPKRSEIIDAISKIN